MGYNFLGNKDRILNWPQTKICINCGEPITRVQGHIHVRGIRHRPAGFHLDSDVVTAGWCDEEECQQKYVIIKRQGCYATDGCYGEYHRFEEGNSFVVERYKD